MKLTYIPLPNGSQAVLLRLWLISCLISLDKIMPCESLRAAKKKVPTAKLSNGIRVPLVGLGCSNGVDKQEVLTALEVGYRFLDTAQSYQWGYNEKDVAEAIRESAHVYRHDVFVTTKVHPENLGYEATKKAVQSSLDLAGFQGYLDAVLIHKPACSESLCDKEPEGTWQESWKALEELYEKGVVKAIGICDVEDEAMLDELLQQRIKPHIIQNWFDPFHQETSMRTKIQANGILYQGYSTLGSQWTQHKGLLENPVHNSSLLKDIAEWHGAKVEPAQVVIQWATKKGISVLPSSRDGHRQSLNLLESFHFYLTQEELEMVDAMDGHAPTPDQQHVPERAISLKVQNVNDIVVEVYWLNAKTEEEVLLDSIDAQQEDTFNSFHGHTFVFREQDTKRELMRHIISHDEGAKQEIVVEGAEDEL